MITWKLDIQSQKARYDEVKSKLKTGFYQNLGFYILPFMPEKFRNRVVFLPETCEQEKILRKQKSRLNKLETDWKKSEKAFIKKLAGFFPKIASLDITVSPSFYGPIGSYRLGNNRLTILPRYDRKLADVQKLLINALAHYFFFGAGHDLEKSEKAWLIKQNKAREIQDKIFPNSKSRPMTKILDGEFAGNLAQKSVEYLKKLKFLLESKPLKPKKLTPKERKIFNLLSANRDILVSFEEIGDAIWGDIAADKYSEYAITKLMERLKKKLPKNSIHSQRGGGYILFSP